MQEHEPASLYCADETEAASFAACQQMVEPLYGFARTTGALEPRLATHCAPDDRATVWTCDLRSGVTFHDGFAFDANDVVVS